MILFSQKSANLDIFSLKFWQFFQKKCKSWNLFPKNLDNWKWKKDIHLWFCHFENWKSWHLLLLSLLLKTTLNFKALAHLWDKDIQQPVQETICQTEVTEGASPSAKIPICLQWRHQGKMSLIQVWNQLKRSCLPGSTQSIHLVNSIGGTMKTFRSSLCSLKTLTFPKLITKLWNEIV